MHTEALQKQCEAIAKAAKTGIGLYVAGKVLGAVLAKIGEGLASWGFPVMRSAAEALAGDLLGAAASVGAFAGKVVEYLSLCMWLTPDKSLGFAGYPAGACAECSGCRRQSVTPRPADDPVARAVPTPKVIGIVLRGYGRGSGRGYGRRPTS